MRKFRNALLYCSILFLMMPGTMSSQTKQEMKSQAESQLKRMTPEQVEEKIRELGMTRSEALQKARELGINLEEFIRIADQKKLEEENLTIESEKSDTTLPEEKFFTLQPRKKVLKQIPGFKGRLGKDSLLQPFGYDIFQYPSSTYQPVMNVATSPSYNLGIGDEVIITVWGETKLLIQQTINKEGNVVISDVGPVGAVGLTVQQLKERLLKRMTSVYSSLRNGASNASSFMDVSIGKVKTLQIFVLGEVVQPGGYSITSLSTIMTALYASGGPTVNGSLREVVLRREGKIFKTLDLYDYILRADNSKDVRLQDGDIIFVKPVGEQVAIVGTLFRPAIYELKPQEHLKDLLAIAGGLTFESYFNKIHIERIIPFSQRTEFQKNIQNIDLSYPTVDDLLKSTFDLSSGDIVTIKKINEEYQNRVSIHGNVHKPGFFEFKPAMKVKDLIIKADSLDGSTFYKALLFRMMPNKKRSMLSFDPNRAMADDPVHNIAIENEDSVIVYKENEFFRTRTVAIAGSIRKPGTYSRSENMTLTQLIVLAGGLLETATTNGIEISHVDTTNIQRYAVTEKISIPKEYWNQDEASQYFLRDLDFVFIPHDPFIGEIKTVVVAGMVKFPGVYPVQGLNDRLADIIQRAGGIREGAYLEAGEYYRASKSTGKVPLDMKNAVENPSSPDNLIVGDGDSIYIGQRDDIVFVRGEVYVPSPVIYKKGSSLEYYIEQAGGYTEEANEDGAVAFLPTGKKWESNFFIFPDPDIMPGSTIYVPKKVEKVDTTFPYIRDIVTILASLAAITVSVVSISKQ